MPRPDAVACDREHKMSGSDSSCPDAQRRFDNSGNLAAASRPAS